MKLKQFLFTTTLFVVFSLVIAAAGNILTFIENGKTFSIFEDMVLLILSNIMLQAGGIYATVAIKGDQSAETPPKKE